MSVRYQVPVSAEVLAQFLPAALVVVRGLRFIRSDGPWAGNPAMVLCTFEDDGAPPDLEGQLVDLSLGRADTPEGPLITVIGRSIIT